MKVVSPPFQQLLRRSMPSGRLPVMTASCSVSSLLISNPVAGNDDMLNCGY